MFEYLKECFNKLFLVRLYVLLIEIIVYEFFINFYIKKIIKI